MTVEEAGTRYVDQCEGLRRKPSTVSDYKSTIRVHLEPYFGATPLDAVTAQDVRGFMAAKAREGKAPKSIINYINLLSSIFDFGCRRDGVGPTPARRSSGRAWRSTPISGFSTSTISRPSYAPRTWTSGARYCRRFPSPRR